MILFIEPTGEMTFVDGVPCRRWTGRDDEGVPVEVMVISIVPQTSDAAVKARYGDKLHDLGLAEPTVADGLLSCWFKGGQNGG